ncbi:hypothetical protein [Rhizomonospora bruguierae]|uniref:hypothetical protein n=1 Tax=Rhizomonospora bruguierae TaxID=1581705 RepID=UPI001BCF714B|nr:hypothetical protein [Micromonospora sp. NBRC 107566]
MTEIQPIQLQYLRVRDDAPVVIRDPIAQMVQRAAEQGVDLEVTFRARPLTSTNARQPVHATYLGSRPMSPTELALHQQMLAAPQTFAPRGVQGVVPARQWRTVAVFGGVAVGTPAVMFGLLAPVAGVPAALVLTLAFVAVALRVLLRRRGTSGSATGHCPGAFHR